MRIGVDVRLFSEGRRSGVEEYAENILEHLFAIDQKNEYHLFFNAWQSEIGRERVDALLRFPNVHARVLNIPNKILNSSLLVVHWPAIDSLLNGVDVFFSPNMMFTALSKKVRHVITIHDLAFELYPEFLTLKRRLWHYLVSPKKQTRNAAAVIAVSEATKQDLIHIYQLEPEKIHTVHSGLRPLAAVPQEKDREILARLNIPSPYILFFATLEPRKNMLGLLAAYKILREKMQQPPALVFAGLKGWREKDVKRNSHARLSGTVFTGEVTEEEKTVLYRNAICMMYPSLYEGFGFPPLEAMESGTPVITAHTTSLPEVVQDAALMVDPHNLSALAHAMQSMVEDKNLRDWYIQKGKERTKHFSWEKSAQQTLEILTKAHE